ncbi:hypothetical protein [Paenibacillus apis]|nr:hypothetical protein [Paenibacillus apis]
MGVLDRLPAGATAGTLEGYSDAANIADYAETAQILYNLLTK